jgi:hypothetical protein
MSPEQLRDYPGTHDDGTLNGVLTGRVINNYALEVETADGKRYARHHARIAAMTSPSTRDNPRTLTKDLHAELVEYLVAHGRHGSMLSADTEDLLIAAAIDEDDTVVGSHDHDGLICVSHGPWAGWYQGTPPRFPPVNTMQAASTNGIR